jgi:DNA-binding response OmpR family regulator
MSETTTHHCLVVEDDIGMARELIDLVEAMGFEHTHVETREDALAHIGTTQFCFILLDLEIKVTSESIKARVVTGYELLRAIRARSPPGVDVHSLPVIVVSAHAKEKDEIFKVARMGATDMVHKPLDSDELEQKIRKVLQEAGRAAHKDCPRFSEAIKLGVSGRREKRRNEVIINGKSAHLTDSSLSVLLQLVCARLAGGGWVDKGDLGVSEGSQKIKRLRDDLKEALSDELVQNDLEGGYRLSPAVSIGHVDCELLSKNHEKGIQKLAQRIADLQRGPMEQSG